MDTTRPLRGSTLAHSGQGDREFVLFSVIAPESRYERSAFDNLCDNAQVIYVVSQHALTDYKNVAIALTSVKERSQRGENAHEELSTVIVSSGSKRSRRFDSLGTTLEEDAFWWSFHKGARILLYSCPSRKKLAYLGHPGTITGRLWLDRDP